MKSKLALLATASGVTFTLSLCATPHKVLAGGCGFLDITCSPSNWKTPSQTIEDNIVKPVFGRCGVNGEGHIKVTNKLATKVYVLLDKEKDAAGDPYGQELSPGESYRRPICNRNGARIKVFTPENCGKSFLAESRFNRVYNEDSVDITTSGFKFSVGDFLDKAGRGAGFALTFLAQSNGIPPQLLAEMGVNEAKVVGDCSSTDPLALANCARSIYKWLPQDMLTTIKNDKCLSKVLAYGNSQNNPYTNPQQNPQQNNNGSSQLIASSYQTAFGRNPSEGEVNYWLGQGQINMNTLMYWHRDA